MPPLLQTIIISQSHDAMNLVSVETSNRVGASSACKKKQKTKNTQTNDRHKKTETKAPLVYSKLLSILTGI